MTDRSLGGIGGGIGGERRGWPAWFGLLPEAFLAERERWPLWLPVLGGIGIVCYFGLDAEPPGWVGACLAGLLSCVVLALRVHLLPVLLGAALVAGSLGFAAAQLRTALVDQPMLAREIGPMPVAGRVIGLDRLPAGVRVLLDQVAIARLPSAETPGRVRVRLSGTTPMPPMGARLEVLAILDAPSRPAAPGAYDFRRHAFFEGIGGIGYAVGQARIIAPADPQGWRLGLETVRQRIGIRVRAVLEGDQAAIAEALLNGERGAISEAANEAMRNSGLAHLISISGLHIGLVATLLFAGLRTLLAAIEPVALRRPIKKWAAAVALLGTVGYTLLVGAPVPTQRACLMTGIVLLAVLVDRTALSMRLIAWAAVAVLAIAPESVLGPSFQMSFGAVVALIAVYEANRDRFARWREDSGWSRRLALYLAGVALTTLVASAATTPFALYHFQRFASYGLIANLLAVPLTSFWIMPCALVSYFLMPLGLEAPTLTAMGWGVAAILWIAETTAAWPGASVLIPAMPGWGLAAFALGGLWLCVWRRAWCWAGLVGLAVGAASPAFTARPDILINEEGSLVAVRDEAGGLMLSSSRADPFGRDIWLRRDGQADYGPWPDTAAGRLSCDPLGCLYAHPDRRVALVRDPHAFAEDCRIADIVIATVPAPRACAAAIIDRFDLWRNGAHAVTLDRTGARIESVADGIGDRPWALRR